MPPPLTGYVDRFKGKVLAAIEVGKKSWGMMGQGGDSSYYYSGTGQANVQVANPAASNPATTVVNTLATYNIPAGALDLVGAGFYIQAWGRFAATVSNKQVTLNIGGQITLGTGSNTSTAWELDATLFKTATNVQKCLIEGWAGATRIGHTAASDTNIETNVILVTVTCQDATASASEIFLDAFYVDYLQAR